MRNYIRKFTQQAPEWVQPWPTITSSPNPRPPPPIPRPMETEDAMRRRILLSCRKRGILETDLLHSTFCKKYLDKLNLNEMKEFDTLLNENDWDIFYWATGMITLIVGTYTLPDHISKLSIVPKLMEHCKNKEKVVLRMPEVE